MHTRARAQQRALARSLAGDQDRDTGPTGQTTSGEEVDRPRDMSATGLGPSQTAPSGISQGAQGSHGMGGPLASTSMLTSTTTIVGPPAGTQAQTSTSYPGYSAVPSAAIHPPSQAATGAHAPAGHQTSYVPAGSMGFATSFPAPTTASHANQASQTSALAGPLATQIQGSAASAQTAASAGQPSQPQVAMGNQPTVASTTQATGTQGTSTAASQTTQPQPHTSSLNNRTRRRST